MGLVRRIDAYRLTSATSSKDDADSIPTYTINFHARLFHQFLCVLYRFFEC